MRTRKRPNPNREAARIAENEAAREERVKRRQNHNRNSKSAAHEFNPNEVSRINAAENRDKEVKRAIEKRRKINRERTTRSRNGTSNRGTSNYGTSNRGTSHDGTSHHGTSNRGSASNHSSGYDRNDHHTRKRVNQWKKGWGKSIGYGSVANSNMTVFVQESENNKKE